MRWLDGIIGSMEMSFWQTPGNSEGQGTLHAIVHVVSMSWTQVNDEQQQELFSCSKD